MADQGLANLADSVHAGRVPRALQLIECVDGDEPTGFAYGAPLQPGREWWRPTASEPNNGYTATYAVSEVMVRPQWRKQGSRSGSTKPC